MHVSRVSIPLFVGLAIALKVPHALAQLIDHKSVTVSHNSGTINIYNYVAHVTASCPAVTSSVDDATFERLAALAAGHAAHGTAEAWQDSMSKLTFSLMPSLRRARRA